MFIHRKKKKNLDKCSYSWNVTTSLLHVLVLPLTQWVQNCCSRHSCKLSTLNVSQFETFSVDPAVQWQAISNKYSVLSWSRILGMNHEWLQDCLKASQWCSECEKFWLCFTGYVVFEFFKRAARLHFMIFIYSVCLCVLSRHVRLSVYRRSSG